MKTQISKLTLQFIVNHQANIVRHVDGSRQSMTKVHARVSPDEKAWIIESTDGHRLVTNMVDLKEITLTDAWSPSIAFPDAFADDFKLALKKAKNIAEYDMIDVSEFTVICLKEEFPDLQQVMPKAESLQWSVSFNAEYLEEMLKAMRDNKRQTAVTLKFSGDKNPIVVTCGGSSYGVLMPVRGDTQWGPSESDESVAS